MMNRINRFTLKAAEDARIEALHGDSLNTPSGTLAFASGFKVQRDATSGGFRLRDPPGDNIAVWEGNLADCFVLSAFPSDTPRSEVAYYRDPPTAISFAGRSTISIRTLWVLRIKCWSTAIRVLASSAT